MKIDIAKTFAELYPDNRKFLEHLNELQQYLLPREKSRQWAQNLRFIAPASNSEGIDDVRAECSCAKVPSFVGREDDTLVKVTSAGAYPECTDYIAVSWCWRSSSSHRSSGAQLPEYSVSIGESKRPCKVPNHILSRAICYAARNQIPFIWIDKECIDQNDRDDKEFGIQSMDLVYQRSRHPLCLLECYFSTQIQIDVLTLLMEGKDPTPEQMTVFVDVVNVLEQESSFTRAWILQETVSGGFTMDLMIQHDPKLSKSPILGDMIGEILISIEELLNMATFAFNSVQQVSGLMMDQQEKATKSVDKIVAYHPAYMSKLGDGASLWTVFTDPEYRQTCNAAQALAYLALRQNSRVPDRIAILANLCNYHLRLDTFKVDQLGFDFSICAFALALFNGDLSLTKLVQSSTTPTSAYAWGPSEGLCLKSLAYDEENDVVVRAEPARLTLNGLLLKGWLWRADSVLIHPKVSKLSGQAETITDCYWIRITLTSALLEAGFTDLAECLYAHSCYAKFFSTAPLLRWKHWSTPRIPTDSPPRRLSEVFDVDTGRISFRARGLVEEEDDVREFVDKNYLKQSMDSPEVVPPLKSWRGQFWFDEIVLSGRGLPLASLANQPSLEQNQLRETEGNIGTAPALASASDSAPAPKAGPELEVKAMAMAAFDVHLTPTPTSQTQSHPIQPTTESTYIFVPSTMLDTQLAESDWRLRAIGWIVQPPTTDRDSETGCRILRGTGDTCRGFWSVPEGVEAETFVLS